ncbi:MAG: Uma2 family endonuclease [Microcystis viridis Mv_BB_P_19951000_S69]|uniref:Uma2 family endonuclease n=1 Tax=Microcystis viridis Mv_BB_P_19951000_S68D TaxID=2486270 RepID=A0A552HBX5_MICVR|nr:MAG: Uma2 family endonuclease [Microcystis viridis Mv_BB_P_19951000_S69]TRU68728.1 MAG: Uma2 family endonuclease [Microcystis viridis Mv_BB_P_19951000_S68D]TRU76527.1 MAG: Uma2 family endonuclease [Microcystis viridis Mv_BB_P_19951000_S68]TRU90145.1 MAG: Uma2 family endonuclease [Microcystis viridis Mv_BB_P_19951000_S69D]
MSIRENTVMKTPETKVWTDAEFMALPDDGNRYELVKGELINMGNSGALHGYIAIILSAALFGLVTSRKLGVLLDSSTAFTMKNGNKRSPDIAFFAKERLQGLEELPTGFLEGAPDLVVEILSLGSTIAEIEDKIAEYFANGTRLLWVISPGQHYVLVYRSGYEPQRLLTSGDFLEGEEVVPGFTFPVADLFQKLSF